MLRLPERVSYAAAMNAGLAALGDADAVLLLNADCFLDPGALAAALPHLDDPRRRQRRLPASGQDAHPDAIDAAGMWIDRRRKNGLVGHGDPVDRARRGRARCSAPTAPARSTAATRAGAAASTRTWRCG